MSVVRKLPLVQVQPIRSAEWLYAAKRARQLSWLSLVWMGAEGTIGVATGVLAAVSIREGLASWRGEGSCARC